MTYDSDITFQSLAMTDGGPTTIPGSGEITMAF